MKKVYFVILGRDNEAEIYGWLESERSVRLTETGWWRTNDMNEAAMRALLAANISPEYPVEIVKI